MSSPLTRAAHSIKIYTYLFFTLFTPPPTPLPVQTKNKYIYIVVSDTRIEIRQYSDYDEKFHSKTLSNNCSSIPMFKFETSSSEAEAGYYLRVQPNLIVFA